MSFKFIDLFAGIGGIRLGFESQGGTCVFSSEWDKYAQRTYEANFGEKPHGDITSIDPHSIPDHDVLLGGFPCQAFSIIGKMQGFEDTRGTLFFSIAEILRAKKPKAFMLENVKQLKSHDNGNTFKVILKTLEGLGYHVHHTVLNALDFGVPQKRERTFIVGFRDDAKAFRFPKGKRSFSLASILEEDSDVDKGYFVTDAIRRSRIKHLKKHAPFPSIWHQNVSGNISPLPYSCALRAGASYNYLLVNGIRRPTERELLRLQGFPESFKIVVSYAQLRRQAGNSVAVPVVAAVAKQVVMALNGKESTQKIARKDHKAA
ncbi:DNA cytosine methyltransferase [Enterovibrio coralii]|uniref:Cytosine-specific methyltransferase n=1 Tax=Enterovibrio coralii TaxID=294935 RepID=A0A135IDK6_9GAMM|nr:DNA cytosine methyltransferase [Enterovibrio coralii]KXF83485.1 modification methylase [Enterovibrio coralii]